MKNYAQVQRKPYAMNKTFAKIFFVLCGIFLFSYAHANELTEDEFIEEYAKMTEIKKPEINQNYNYDSTDCVKIKIKLNGAPVSTRKKNLYDGMPLDFTVKQNVKYKGKVFIKQGTHVTGEVQTYMTHGMNGIPAMITLNNFEIEGLDKNKIQCFYTKRGHSRTLLLLPIKWALTLLWPSGYLVNFIKGGNATLDDKDVIYLYYYPNRHENI